MNTSCKITIWPIYKDPVYSVSSQKIQWGWASAIWQLDSLFDIVHIVCGAGSIKRSGVRQSVCRISPTQQRRAAGLLLSAVRAKDIDRQRPAAAAPQPGAAARRSTANAGNVMLTAELTRLKVMAAYCLVYGVIHFTSLAGWLPVHWDELWAQRSVTSMGKLYLYRGRSKMKNNERGTIW